MSSTITTTSSWWKQQGFNDSIEFSTIYSKLERSAEGSGQPSEVQKQVVLYAINDNTSPIVSLSQWKKFLLRYGPLKACIKKSVACIYNSQKKSIYSWWHGELGRTAAQTLLLNDLSVDGTFLVRYSTSQADKFSLSYVKINSETSKKSVKNCLIENNCTTSGNYNLVDNKLATFNSVAEFILQSSSRLTVPIISPLSQKLTIEEQDDDDDGYGAFTSSDIIEASGDENPYGDFVPPAPNDLVGSYSQLQVSDMTAGMAEFDAGVASFESQDFPAALESFTSCINTTDDDSFLKAKALANVGTLHLVTGSLEQAITSYKECLPTLVSLRDTHREITVRNNGVIACMRLIENDTNPPYYKSLALEWSQRQLSLVTNSANVQVITDRINTLES